MDLCLQGSDWPAELLSFLTTEENSEALFRIVVEGLADRFDPALCDRYAALFVEAIAAAVPGTDPGELRARYDRVRKVRRFEGKAPRRVYVLSRVTLGADVVVTSAVLDAVKKRFPEAEIYLAGGRKNWELFAADPRVMHLPVSYRRGTLRERLACLPELSERDSIVVDPDSRLTQLGLLPVCPEECYYFFESRAYGETSTDPLNLLTRRWLAETFGVPDGSPYIAVAEEPTLPRPLVSVSFGVGENPAKRIADPFEEELLRHLGAGHATVCVDRGAGGEEAHRVSRALERTGVKARTWNGSFAGFAAIVAQSDLYVGYDSAGQHVAAACGVPLVSIFAGYPNLRMFHRWKPCGAGPIEVIRVDDPDPATVLPQAIDAIQRFALR